MPLPLLTLWIFSTSPERLLLKRPPSAPSWQHHRGHISHLRTPWLSQVLPVFLYIRRTTYLGLRRWKAGWNHNNLPLEIPHLPQPKMPPSAPCLPDHTGHTFHPDILQQFLTPGFKSPTIARNCKKNHWNQNYRLRNDSGWCLYHSIIQTQRQLSRRADPLGFKLVALSDKNYL